MERTAYRRDSSVSQSRERENSKGSNMATGVLSFLGRNIVYIAIVAFAIYIVANFFVQQPYIQAKETEMSKVQSEIEEAKKENGRLQLEKDEIGTREYKEKIAREKLGLVKKGEKVFIDVEE